MKKEKCVWVYDEYHDFWDTSCGKGWLLTEGSLKDNKIKYCPFCGKKIKDNDPQKRL